ncbi:MAG TPA: SDR family NAD(P)-dependent oxidoreductase [Acidimicrobiales bacterium]|jgi:3-oxoacyl-[acyl-carrier protein] reductase
MTTHDGRRVAIVTGGASGIGRAAAAGLEATGAAVAVFDRAGDPPVDVSDAAGVEAAVQGVRERLGSIDILVNAAGIPALADLSDPGFGAVWDQTLAVNLQGTLNTVRACLDDLLASEAGRIVNIASTEALTAGRMGSPYTVSKHAVVGLTRSLAVDLGRRGVTANCVCPGATLTGMTAPIPEEARAAYGRRNIPLGRYGSPEEVAYMVVALTAPEASFVNGAIIPVDGGMTAMSR